MSQEEFKKQQEIACNLVKTWPLWKQNLLNYSSKPTVSEPRTPVICITESENIGQKSEPISHSS